MTGPLSLALPTLFFTGAVAGLLAAFIVLGSRATRGEERGATRLFGWSMAMGAASAGILWLESRNAGGPVPLAGLFALGQAALLLQASLRLFGGRQPAWLIPAVLYASVPAYLAASAFLPSPAPFVVAASVHATLNGLAAFHAWRARGRTGAGFRNAFAALHALLGLLTLARVATILAAGPHASPLGVYTGSPLHGSAALVWALSPLLTALAVLGVLNERMARRLLDRAQTDELTGVHSRRHLLEEAPRMLARLRARGQRSAVMMLDLDHFKRINDEHGHRAGDLVLRRAAQAMRKAMRADSLLARYGGEEFCAIVPVDDEDDATRAAERIRATLSRLALSIDQRPLRLSVSIGLAVQRGDLRFDELLAIADEGVYLAKERGRDCVIAPGSSPEISRPARPRAAPRVRHA